MFSRFLRWLGLLPEPTTTEQVRALFSAESKVKPRYQGTDYGQFEMFCNGRSGVARAQRSAPVETTR